MADPTKVKTDKKGNILLTPEEYQKIIEAKSANDAMFASMMKMGYGGASDGTTIAKSATKLNASSAKALLEQTMKENQLDFKLSSADITAFMNEFNATQAKQLESVVKSVRTSVPPGTSETAIQNQVVNTMQTQYPSFFKPSDFAKNYIWAKTNFGDTTTVGPKGVQALNDVRAVLKNFNYAQMSELEIQTAAREIAKGNMTKADFITKVSDKALLNYPLISDRVKQTPGATVRDILGPYINTIAQELELDPNTLDLNDPLLDKIVRPDGTGGKLPMLSLGDAKMLARKDPRYDKTVAANNNARDAAVGLANAFGKGV